jgi:hypothetical protein
MISVSQWISWLDGIDLHATTSADIQSPNVIVHLGRTVNTPVGNAPAGMILWQPDPSVMPAVTGFVCSDKVVAKYIGSNIFADTPFEHAPILSASINVNIYSDKAISSCIVGGYHFEVEMNEFSAPYMVYRQPASMPPFWQQGIEISCGKTVLKINGEIINIIVPPVGITGGPASVVKPNGIYAR